MLLSCRHLPAVLLATGLAIITPSSLFADVNEQLLADGWEEVTFDGKMPNSFDLQDDQVLTVESRNSVSLLRKSMTIDVASTPILTWEWSLTESAPATDLTVRGEDDRSLALFVAFPYVPEQATFFEQVERHIVEREAGTDAPGRVLIYVWGGEGERDDVLKSPYFGNSGGMIILRPAETEVDKWFKERVDIIEDYRRVFGDEAPPVMSIAISADTDDTQSQSRGLVTNIDFLTRPPAS